VELDWIGHEYEIEYGSARFAIKSNTPIKLVAEFAPLTNGEYQILTELDVERYDGQLWIFPIYTPVMFGIATNGTRTLNSFGVVQTVDHKEYRVGVGGMLGDIHHQAAGEYNTTIHFTIEAAN
jgi:hypothetical protein